jgi:hypothetical protein
MDHLRQILETLAAAVPIILDLVRQLEQLLTILQRHPGG